MPNQERSAIALMGAGLGYGASYSNLTDDSDSKNDVRLYKRMAHFGVIAAAMVEAAFTVTFSYPENYEWEIYWALGDAYADMCSSDDDDINEPEESDFLDKMEEVIIYQFRSVAVETQYDSISSAVAQARLNTA